MKLLVLAALAITQLIPQNQAKASVFQFPAGHTHIQVSSLSQPHSITCLMARWPDGKMVGGQVATKECQLDLNFEKPTVVVLAVENEADEADTLAIKITQEKQ
jgi:hypothetical protein